ncbi:LytR C-terminal domain-containing protein [Yinghuangia seranimata]|uniref:LytR C-terminal domain-containing protein n=1 Tax=Yinghuangia seranimata TaxID=408067 RepID=UPI00248B97F6|nr:LytR C-terminal domain-containing protein [Yinghuangia seranimata]MDI2127812.1 LytR C-terminal domain-containing protein [Yinghuangia seranimata]
MSMLTPRGMRGQYKITGKIYPRMTRRRRKWPVVVASLVALAVLSTGAWAVYHYTADDTKTSASGKPCPPASTPPSGKPPASGTPGAVAAPGQPNAQPVAQTLPAPNAITVNVYNATKRTGLAKTVADELKARGFVIGKVANDPANKQIAGAGEIRSGVPGKTPSTVVGAHLPNTQYVEDARTDGSVDLVLGDGYQALATADAAAAALAPAPPPAAAAPGTC